MKIRSFLNYFIIRVEVFNYVFAIPLLSTYVYFFTDWNKDEFHEILIGTGLAFVFVILFFTIFYYQRFSAFYRYEKEQKTGKITKETIRSVSFWTSHFTSAACIDILLRYTIGGLILFSYLEYRFAAANVILFGEIGIALVLTLTGSLLFIFLFSEFTLRKFSITTLFPQLKIQYPEGLSKDHLARRLTAQTLLSFLFVIMLIFVINYRLDFKEETKVIGESMRTCVFGSESVLRLTLVEFRDKLTTSIFGTTNLRQPIFARKKDQIQSVLNSIHLSNTNHATEALFFYNPTEGIFIATNDYKIVDQKNAFSIRDVELSKSGPLRHSTFKSPISGEMISPYTLPVYNNEVFQGYVGGFLNIGKLGNFILGNIRIGIGGKSGLIDEDGTIVYSPEKNQTGTNGKQDKKFAPFFISTDAFQTFDYTENGKPKRMAFVHNPEFQYYIYTMYEISELYEKSVSSLLNTLFISALSLFIIGILTILAIESKLTPLAQMKENLGDMVSGNLSSHFATASQDEIGNMAEALIKFQQKLKNIVKNTQSTALQLSNSSSEILDSMVSLSDAAQSQAAGSEEISASVEEITAGIESVAARADTQSFTLESLMRKMEDLNQAINDIDKSFSQADAKVEEITKEAKLGESSLNEMKKSMDKIYESSTEMTSVIEIIHTISEQINLLALNAAIEAARAGVSGRGFAVVADEISKLADKTAKSIDDIEALIEQNEGEIKIGQEKIDHSINTLSGTISGVNSIYEMTKKIRSVVKRQMDTNEEVNEGVVQIKELSDMIKNATEEQKLAMTEISRSIAEINNHAQTTALSSEGVRDNAQNMTTLSENLREEINYFHV
jgi:methyl-accepting chemotaxis protein